MDNEEIFRELANDEAIAKALADHEAACTAKPTECPACRFFDSVHFVRHMIDLVDSAKVLDLAGSYANEFVSDILAISQFFSATAQYFIDEMVDWDGMQEEDDDYDEDEDD